MVEAYMKQSALAHLGLNARSAPDGPTGVKMAEVANTGKIGLRLDASNKKILDAAEKALGFALPIEANTVTSKGKKSALWLGPNEWLLTTDQPEKLQKALTKALENHHAAVYVVTDSRITISLSGKNARDVLKKGCGIDLHPKVFGPGQCAQTPLALGHALIHQVVETKKTKAATYHVTVHRSFAEYTWAWLEDAAGEYGVTYRQIAG